MRIEGNADRYDHRENQDDYSQVRALFADVMSQGERERLFMNIAGTWGDVPEFICERQLAEFKKVHEDYEAGERKAWEQVKAEGGYKPNAAPVTEETPQKA